MWVENVYCAPWHHRLLSSFETMQCRRCSTAQMLSFSSFETILSFVLSVKRTTGCRADTDDGRILHRMHLERRSRSASIVVLGGTAAVCRSCAIGDDGGSVSWGWDSLCIEDCSLWPVDRGQWRRPRQWEVGCAVVNFWDALQHWLVPRKRMLHLGLQRSTIQQETRLYRNLNLRCLVIQRCSSIPWDRGWKRSRHLLRECGRAG